MKWFIPVFLILIAACSSPNNNERNQASEEADADAIHIHFQTGFYEDTLLLFHGKEKVYEKVLTTTEGSSFTDKYSISREELKDSLRFRLMASGQLLEGYIPVKKDPYIGFYLTSGTAVNIYASETPFEYEKK